MFPSHKSNLHSGSGEGNPNGEGKKKHTFKAKEKNEWVQVLTSRVAHICCYLCVIFPLQILIILSENGGGLRSTHQTVTWGPNHINQSLEWSFLNWCNNESTSVPYLRFKLLMGNCEKQSRGRELTFKKLSWEIKKQNKNKLCLCMHMRLVCKIPDLRIGQHSQTFFWVIIIIILHGSDTLCYFNS